MFGAQDGGQKLPGDFHHVIEQQTVDAFEPVRHAVRHDNHVAGVKSHIAL